MRNRARARLDPARFGAALAAWMTDHGLAQREAAERLGVSQPRISAWMLGNAVPSPATAAMILPILRAEDDHGRFEAARIEPGAGPPPPDVDNRIVLIPRDPVGAAGHHLPTLHGDNPDAVDPYPADEIRRLVGFDPNLLRSALVIGDSMRDLLRPGTRVMYLPTTEITDHGLYVLDFDDAQIIKLVQRLGGGVLALIPRNDDYRTETLMPCEDADTPHTYRSDLSGRTCTLRVIGKVTLYPMLA